MVFVASFLRIIVNSEFHVVGWAGSVLFSTF